MSGMSEKNPFNVLVVDNKPADVELIRMAFADKQLPYRLTVVGDGVQALNFLRRTGPNIQAVRPDLILMDLRLPGKSGLDVLAEIKGDDQLKQIPVVILTSSRVPGDIQNSYSLHANSYVIKPVDLDEYIGVVQKIGDFWQTAIKPPGR